MQNSAAKQLPAITPAIFLAKLESAHKMLATATCPTVAIEVKARAEQLKLYAKQRGLSQEIEQKAHALFVDALDRLGELDELSKGGRGKKSVPNGNGIKVSRKERMKGRRLHSLPEDEKEQFRSGKRSISELDHRGAADFAKAVDHFHKKPTSKQRWLARGPKQNRVTVLSPAVRQQNAVNVLEDLIRSKSLSPESEKAIKELLPDLKANVNVLEEHEANNTGGLNQ